VRSASALSPPPGPVAPPPLPLRPPTPPAQRPHQISETLRRSLACCLLALYMDIVPPPTRAAGWGCRPPGCDGAEIRHEVGPVRSLPFFAGKLIDLASLQWIFPCSKVTQSGIFLIKSESFLLGLMDSPLRFVADAPFLLKASCPQAVFDMLSLIPKILCVYVFYRWWSVWQPANIWFICILGTSLSSSLFEMCTSIKTQLRNNS
jgi:hypothetical protein